MKSSTRIVVLGFCASIASGCMKTVDVKPDYDEAQKTVSIDSLVIKPVFTRTESSEHRDRFDAMHQIKELFHTGDSSCPDFVSLSYFVPPEFVFGSAMYEGVLREFNGQCDIDNVSNAYVMTCANGGGDLQAAKRQGDLVYFVTSSLFDIHFGYRNLAAIVTNNSDCKNKLKNHVFKVANTDAGKTYKASEGKWQKVTVKAMLD